MKWLALLLMLPSVAFAGGPKSTFPQPRGLDAEVINLYHDIANPVINIGSASTMTITQDNVSTITLSGRIQFKDGTTQTTAATSKFLQVIQATNTATTSTTSTSYADSALSKGITPTSASSKIVIWVTTYAFINTNGAGIIYGISRNGTDLVANGMANTTMALAGRTPTPVTFVYVDSPATTSSTAYVLRVKSNFAGNDVRDNIDNLLASMVIAEVQ